MMKNILNVKSPLTITALFIGLCEIGFGMLSKNVSMPEIAVYGMVALPFFVYFLFFIVWFWKPYNLYAPTDFKDQENFLALHDKINRIEENPFIKYSNLDEPAIRLFLTAYYELKNPKHQETKKERWNKLIEQFNEVEIKQALNKLVEYDWLSKREDPFDLTSKGKKVHNLLKHFVYGRLG